MNGSGVVTQVLEKVVPPVVLKRGRQDVQEELPLPPPMQLRGQAMVPDNVDDKERLLVVAEETWFKKHVQEGLVRARRVLTVLNTGNNVLADVQFLQHLAQLTSLTSVMESLPGVAGEAFRSWFTDEEWQELEASSACIANANLRRLRTLQLKRQKYYLDRSCSMAIDLTVVGGGGGVGDEAEVEKQEEAEQSVLVQGCTSSVQLLLDRFGMNSRGLIKRIVKERQVPVIVVQKEKAKSKKSKKREEMEAGGDDEEVIDEGKSKNKKKSKGGRRKNVAEIDAVGEEEEDEDDENDVVFQLQDGEEEGEDEGVVGEDSGLKELFKRAREDVSLVEAMLQEANAGGGGVEVKIGNISIPDLKMATKAVGKTIFADVEKLKRCLGCLKSAELSSVEKWGVMCKWLRCCEQAISVTGLFSHLKSMRKSKSSLKKRYKILVSHRFKKEDKVLSFRQAERYDRLGKFLLKFPKFMLQLQLVSLSDWFQKVDSIGKALLDSVEFILGSDDEGDELEFWRQQPLLAEVVVEMQQEASLVVDLGVAPLSAEVVAELFPAAAPRDLNQNVPELGDLEDNVEGEEGLGDDVVVAEQREECPDCGLKAKVVFLQCDGPGDGHSFCWRCAGYSVPPPDELPFPGCDGDDDATTTIKTYVFCAEHLNLACCTRPFESYQRHGGQLAIAEFVNHVQAVEARQMVAIFTALERQFSVVHIEPNGWCMFVAAAKGLDMHWDDLVREMIKFARRYLRKKANVAAMADAEMVRRLWNELDPLDLGSVQAFWSSEAADHLIPMVAAYLNTKDKRAVQFRVWVIGKDGALEMSKLVYPEGETSEFKKVVDLLKTNKIVEHYDLLIN